MKNILIVTGGTIAPDFATDYLEARTFETIIAVDFGLESMVKLGRIPDYIVGDFDSVSEQTMLYFKECARNSKEEKPIVIQYPSQKDDTDTQLAIELAVSLKPDSITILGASGTRMDHFLANMNLLMIPLENGIPAQIVDAHNRLYLIDSNHAIARSEAFGPFISLIPLTQSVKGVTLKGFKYPLVERELIIGESIGISNELTEETGYIELKQGVLIVIEARD